MKLIITVCVFYFNGSSTVPVLKILPIFYILLMYVGTIQSNRLTLWDGRERIQKIRIFLFYVLYVAYVRTLCIFRRKPIINVTHFITIVTVHKNTGT